MTGSPRLPGLLALIVPVALGCAKPRSQGTPEDSSAEDMRDTGDIPEHDPTSEDPAVADVLGEADAVDVMIEDVSGTADASEPDAGGGDAGDAGEDDPIVDTGSEMTDATSDPSSLITLTAVADAFVCSDDWASNNYGTRNYSPRAVGRQNAYTGEQIGRQFYRFTAPSTLGSATIASAELRLKMYDNFAGFPVVTSVYGLGDSWTETAVTWNTQPAEDSTEIDSVTASCCGIVYTYDVTSYVNAQLAAGDLTISFSQRAPDETVIGGVRWFQREGHGVTIGSITGEAPRLIIAP